MRIFSLIILSALFATGCNVINPQEKVPAYFHIDSFSFVSTDPSRHGSISNNITSVWVYWDNEHVGVYDIELEFEGDQAVNYAIAFDADNNAFVVTPLEITVTAADKTKVFGVGR